MPPKRFKTEETIHKLREADILLSQGRNVARGLSSDPSYEQHLLSLAEEARA